MFKNYFLFFIVLFLSFNTQIIFSQSYNEISLKYENLPEDDEKAMSYVMEYIKKAKEEKNFLVLTQGYKDAGFFSPKLNVKLKFADSAICSAKLSKDNDQITHAYLGKGIIYYFNFKKYQPALNEYLKAYQYSKKSTDEYQKYKVIYHIGVVKSYLGYYTEALDHFRNCMSFFESKTQKKLHPNLLYNNKKGYLNSLHQAVVCYRNLGNYKKADSLIKVGLSVAGYSKDFELEIAYLLKCRGILYYHQKKYNEAIKNFNIALPVITKNKDFAWESLGYFYKGKTYLAKGDERIAVQNFLKVDSVFHRNNFILPELLENYKLLIDNAKKNEDPSKELYYTKSLLKADSIINKDFVHLSSRVHKEYDIQGLMDAKNKLESHYSWSKIFVVILLSISIILAILLHYRNRREKEIVLRYNELEEKLKHRESIIPVEKKNSPYKSILGEEVTKDILAKLEKWERKNGFKEKGLNQNKLAKKLNTNDNYLSQVINENRGMNFNRYLAELRINYITDKLYNDKKI